MVFDSCQLYANDTDLCAYNRRSTTTSPLINHGTASARLHRQDDSTTTRLHRQDYFAAVLTSFCVLPHDMQDYDYSMIKAKFESLHDSMTQLDTRGIPAAAQEQDGHSKPMKPKTS
jgi:hypothetical protein